jgi:hypothetical protein
MTNKCLCSKVIVVVTKQLIRVKILIWNDIIRVIVSVIVS